MNILSRVASIASVVLASLIGGTGAMAATFVYISNAEDGDIGTYRLLDSGALEVGPRVKAAAVVMPMAVSPDKRFLYAAARSKPYTVYVYSINSKTGALTQVSTSPLAESFPYISLDRTGRYLLGAAYGAHLISVNPVDADGKVGATPLQVIPVGRNAHSIRVDGTNRHAYVMTLGTDELFMFDFDAATGKLASKTPSVVLMPPLTGPRHFVTSSDNRFLYMLSELRATVTSFAIDPATGLLKEASSVAALSPASKLEPGAPRAPITGPNAPPPRNADNDIWAADIHLTPNGKFMVVSERTQSTLNVLSVDSATGKLTYLSSVPTEAQPRGFAIDPSGRFLVASGEKSETVSLYSIAPQDGALKLLGKYPGGKDANWVEFVAFD
jgi:6-phosphogluconolactonase